MATTVMTNNDADAQKASSFDLMEDDVEEELEDDEKSLTSGVKPWDEGGASDCGYSELVHNMLMRVGGGIHSVVGGPQSDTSKKLQVTISNWFQELSYATRDIIRGGENTKDMQKDAADAVNELISSGHSALQATGSTISTGITNTSSTIGGITKTNNNNNNGQPAFV